MRTYGTCEIGKNHFTFRIESHVAIRMQRFFGEARIRDNGTIVLPTTPSNIVDVDWFLQRYPMTVTRSGGRDGRPWIASRAAEHAALMEDVALVLQGDRRPDPVALAVPARDYQLRVAHALRRTGRLLCADELGLGKTVTALAALAAVDAWPAIAVVPPHLARQWQREAARFLPDLRTHIASAMRPYTVDTDLLILPYSKARGWGHHLHGHARAVIFDECQELRRTGTRKYEACEAIAWSAQYRLGLSATPIYNYGGEFWAVFNILAPGVLGNWGEFVRAWCIESYDRTKTRVADPAAFGSYLREQGLMIRRTRAQVARELPGLTRLVEWVGYDERQFQRESKGALDLARRIMERQGSNFDLLRASQELSALARLATGVSKAPAVAQFVRMLVETTNEPVVLFGWHRAVYDYWDVALKTLGVAWYTGHETPAKKDREIQRFCRGEAKVLIMSLRAGQGVDGLQKVCHRAVIGELDWSPGVVEQCIGRVYRDGADGPVMAYYLMIDGGSDPVIADVLGVKGAQIRGVRETFGADEVIHEADPEHVRRLAANYLQRAGEKVSR
jgi:SNF2 family DNA or RNA helicase